MDTIDYSDLDFESMEPSPYQGGNSATFIQDGVVYKMFTNLSPREKVALEDKLRKMQTVSIDGIIMPQELIMRNGLLMGYTSELFESSIPADVFFSPQEGYEDLYLKLLLDVVVKASKIAREAHQQDLFLQDFSLHNLLVNFAGRVKACDIDSCCYKGVVSPYVSCLLDEYRKEANEKNSNLYSQFFAHDGKPHHWNSNLDNLSLLLDMIYFTFGNTLTEIDAFDFEYLAEKSKNIERIKPIFYGLRHFSNPDVPYLDEVFDPKEEEVVIKMKI